MVKIEILGMGCAKCDKLEETALRAANDLGIEYELVKVKEIEKIMNYGVMVTPALVIDGEVKAAGKLLTLEDIKKMLGGLK
jgi:small redox-active disulfide protein 2